MLIYHLKKYKGDRILLKDVDVKYLNGFVRYLSSAISANSGRQKRGVRLKYTVLYGFLFSSEDMGSIAVLKSATEGRSF